MFGAAVPPTLPAQEGGLAGTITAVVVGVALLIGAVVWIRAVVRPARVIRPTGVTRLRAASVH